MSRESLAARAVRVKVQREGRAPTLLEYAIARVGFLRGSESLWCLVMWTCARRAAGGERPNWERYGEMAAVSRPAAFKALQLLRAVWGEHLDQVADVLDAAAGPQLDEIVSFAQSGSRKDTGFALVVAGPLASPVPL